jgi:DNA-binding beta-propeller fold protein YncE
VVADPSATVAPRTYDLAGNYEPDAFATDNRHLFVLDYQPPQTPDRYVVRQLDLYTGTVSGVNSRSKTAVPEENMRGTRRMHVLSPDHQTLYTLYTHQPDHLHSRDLAAGLTTSAGTVHAFVHVLSLSQGWAYCLDLPQPFGIGPAAAHSLALSPDGSALYVADRSSGMVARVDTDQLTIRATANAGGEPMLGGGLAAAQVGSDGSLFLSGGAQILVLHPKTLAVVRRLPVAGATGGLGLSTDGQRLFASTAESVLALDPQTGTELARFAAPGTERIEHVGPAATR